MSAKYQISEEDIEKIKEVRKHNKNKNVERRLKALLLRVEGKTIGEIGEICRYHPAYVSKIISNYYHKELESLTENHYKANRRNMSFEEETKVLEPLRIMRLKRTNKNLWELYLF